MKALIIGIVDDDHIYRYTTVKALERTKLPKRILAFSDGEDAYHFLMDNVANATILPDVIFLDLNMPNMDGWEFLDSYAKLKPSLEKRITIYVVSSSVSQLDIQRAREISSVSDYLVKPVDGNMLDTILKEIAPEVQ